MVYSFWFFMVNLFKKTPLWKSINCKSSVESNSPDILVQCEINLDDSIDSDNFSVRGYLPLIRKGSVSHMHGLAVYLKE